MKTVQTLKQKIDSRRALRAGAKAQVGGVRPDPKKVAKAMAEKKAAEAKAKADSKAAEEAAKKAEAPDPKKQPAAEKADGKGARVERKG